MQVGVWQSAQPHGAAEDKGEEERSGKREGMDTYCWTDRRCCIKMAESSLIR